MQSTRQNRTYKRMTKKQKTWNLDVKARNASLFGNRTNNEKTKNYKQQVNKRRFSGVKINDESTVEAQQKLKGKEMILSKNMWCMCVLACVFV